MDEKKIRTASKVLIVFIIFTSFGYATEAKLPAAAAGDSENKVKLKN
jgi:hypothetical protein